MRLASSVLMILTGFLIGMAIAFRAAPAAPRWQSHSMQVVQIEQLCPGGPRSYRLVGRRDSLAIVVQGPQRFYMGEIVEVVK